METSPPPSHPGQTWDSDWKDVTSRQSKMAWEPDEKGRLRQRRQSLLIASSCPKRRHNSTMALRSQWEILSFQSPVKSWGTRQQLVCQWGFQTKEAQSLMVSPDSGPTFSPHLRISVWKTCTISYCKTSLPFVWLLRQNQYCIEFSLTFGWNVHAPGSTKKIAVISPFYRCPYLSLHLQAWPWKSDSITATITSPGGN